MICQNKSGFKLHQNFNFQFKTYRKVGSYHLKSSLWKQSKRDLLECLGRKSGLKAKPIVLIAVGYML